MKSLKNILLIAALFAVDSLCARAVKGTTPGTIQPAPVQKQPIIVQIQQPSYTDIRNKILSMQQRDVFDLQTKKLQPSFINEIKNDVRNSGSGIQERDLISLLKTARDQFIPLTGNDDADLDILQAVNRQIDNAIQ